MAEALTPDFTPSTVVWVSKAALRKAAADPELATVKFTSFSQKDRLNHP